MKKLHWYMMGKIADSKSMKKIRREAIMVISFVNEFKLACCSVGNERMQ